MRSRYLIFILLSVCMNSLYAQNKLSGKITDQKSHTPLQGVSVYIPDLKVGAVTDEAGKYSISNVPHGTYLEVVSMIGYASQSREINVSKAGNVDFEMEQSAVDMKQVILTGVSAATEQQTNPVPVKIIGGRDFIRNSSTNIIDAIARIPGVSEMTLGPQISKPFIRGLGYNRVVTINDGIRQEGQQWFDEFGEEIDEFSVNKAEIMMGPASLSYGSDAMAGVINLLGAPPAPEGTVKGNILANYQTNNGLWAASFNLGGNRKGFTWDLRYSNKMAHDYKNKYDGYVANSAYSESAFKAVLGINRPWGFSHLTLSSYSLKTGIIEGARDSATGQFLQHFLVPGPDDSLGIAPSDQFRKYNNFSVIHQHIRHYKAVLDNSFVIGNGRLNVRLGFQQNHRQEANDLTQGDYFNNYFFLNTFNYDARYIFPEKKHWESSVGINGMAQSSQNKGTAFVIPEYSIFDIGLFAITKRTFNKLTLSGGLRFDTRMLKGKNLWVDSEGHRLAGPAPGALADFTAYTSNFSGLSGSVGIAYQFSDKAYGKLNLARGYRAPTAAESGANGIHDGTPFYEIGDHRLKAESSLQVDATLGMASPDLTAEITGFINSIDHYIFAEKLASVFGGDSIREDPALALTPGPAFKYIQGNATLSGTEIQFDLHPHALKGFYFENSYSFVSAKQKDQPDSTKYLPFTPPAVFRSELRYEGSKGRTFKHAYVKFGIEHYFEQDKIYYKYGDETVTPAYTLVNAGIGSDICSGNKTLFSVFISGNNLGDKAYQSSMSRLKYTDENNVTGRIGVFNMGRNFSIKLLIPFDLKNN
jgi:iron complex outermembrane recepter protein